MVPNEAISIFPEPGCAHVWRGDSNFAARMRFHQSWYRRVVLGCEPGKHRKNGQLYGNHLTDQDGEAGRNFLTDGIRKVAIRRLDASTGLVERDRLLFNMLSSQPMCFNLFGPLVLDSDLATNLASALPNMDDDLAVTKVDLEYAPDKATHLNDRTAFDAFIEYRLPGGRLGFVGIECKLTEPFSRNRYEFTDRYRRWMSSTPWWWSPGAEQQFGDPLYNQLWRNHLLVFSMLRQPDTKYDEGFCAVVYHDEDRSCVKALDAYTSKLHPDFRQTLLRWPLGTVVAAWEKLVRRADDRKWLADFRTRYVSLSGSKAAWDAYLPA